MGIPFVTVANYGTVAIIGGQEAGQVRAASRGHGRTGCAGRKRCGIRIHEAGHHACLRTRQSQRDAARLRENPQGHGGRDQRYRTPLLPAFGGKRAGAKLMIKEGLLDGVDACFALHVWANVDSGYVAVAPGPVMASANLFEVQIKGKGSHGSAPIKASMR